MKEIGKVGHTFLETIFEKFMKFEKSKRKRKGF